LVMASKLQIETNVIEFFKLKSQIREDLTAVEAALGGVESLDVAFRAGSEGAFKDPEMLAVLEKLQLQIQALAGVDVTLSFVDFLKDMNRAFHNNPKENYTIPASRELVAQYLLLYDSDDIKDFVNSDYNQARITIRISTHNSTAQKVLIEKIRNIVKDVDVPGLEITLTGRVLQDVNVIDSIFWSQISSLALATGLIWLIMFFILRSFKLGLISLIPNIFPLIFNFGIMAMFGIPLNTATALIAAVAIGIAVDDTIHFMNELMRHNILTGNKSDAVSRALHAKGRAFISSSIILCCGFGILGISSFVPTIYFGLLCAGIMISALIGDLILLPSILLFSGNHQHIRMPSS